MKRHAVLGDFLALSLAAVILVSCVAPVLLVVGAQVSFSATVLLGRPTDTSIAVNVVPSSKGVVYFEYGTASGVYSGQTSHFARVSGTPLDVLMQNLTSNTRALVFLII